MTASWYAAAALSHTVLPRDGPFLFALRVTVAVRESEAAGIKMKRKRNEKKRTADIRRTEALRYFGNGTISKFCSPTCLSSLLAFRALSHCLSHSLSVFSDTCPLTLSSRSFSPHSLTKNALRDISIGRRYVARLAPRVTSHEHSERMT